MAHKARKRPNRIIRIEEMERRVLLSAALMGDAFDYPLGGFNATGLTLAGGAVIAGQQLQLTDAGANESRSALTASAQAVSAFYTTFSFQEGSTGTSSLALAIQNAGATASVTVSFLTTPTTSQTLLTVNGAKSSVSALDSAGVHFASGDLIDVTLEYDGSTLLVSETDATTLAGASQTYTGLNIPSVIGSSAYVGFTGSDASTGNSQAVLNWEFADKPPASTGIGGAAAAIYKYTVSGDYAFSGSGSGFSGTSDGVSFLGQAITGDTTLTAQDVIPAANSSVISGLMLRDSVSASSAAAMIAVTSSGVEFFSRSSTGAAAVVTSAVAESAGTTVYLELVTDGPDVSGYLSTDGSSWALVGTAAIAPTVDHGLSGAVMGLAGTGAATFSSVAMTPTTPIGVDTGAAGRFDYEQEQLWVDVVKESTGFFEASSPTTPVAVNSAGWPTADFAMPGIMQAYSDSAGVYTLSMNVANDPTIVIGGGTLSNQVYNSATQTLTANITVGTSGTLSMTVTNTNGGATNIQILRPGYSLTNTPIFTTNYLNFMESLHPKIIRFMNFTATNDNPVQTWAQRTLPSDPVQTGELPVLNPDGSVNSTFGNQPTGIAWEYAIMLANDLHADMWINIPAEANDNYVTELASLIKSGDTVAGVVYPALDADLNVYVEYGNETWNPGFAAFGYATGMAVSEVVTDAEKGITSPLNYTNLPLTQNPDGSYVNASTWEGRWTARRLLQISNDFASVFGTAAINNRIRPVLSNLANPANDADQLAFIAAEYGPPQNYFYATGAAIYANMDGPGDTTNTVNGGNSNPNLTAAQVIANLEANAVAQAPLYESLASLAGQYGLQSTAYESGPDLSGAEGTFTETGANDSKVTAELSSEFANFLDEYYELWFQNGGGPAIYFTAGVESWGQKYGDYQITDSDLDLTNNKIDALRTVIASPRPAAPSTAQAAPSNFAVAGESSTTVSLKWSAPADPPVDFQIDASTNSTFTANVQTQTAAGNATALTFTGLLPGVVYYFQIRSATPQGVSNNSAAVSAATTGAMQTPAAPSGVTATALNNSTIDVAWIDNAWNESSYAVDIATNSTFTRNLETVTATADSTQATIDSLNASTTYYVQVRAVNSAGSSAGVAAAAAVVTPAAAPIAKYTFSEGSGSTVLDTSAVGTAANGTIKGGVTRTAGPSGMSALTFNGSTGYVDLGTPAKLNFSGEITISAWINTTSVTSRADIVSHTYDGINAPFYLALDNDNTVDFGTYRNGTAVDAIGQTPQPLTDGKWHLLAGVYDGSEFKVYVDGQLIAAMADPYGVTVGSWGFNIGAGDDDSSNAFNYFDGSIADVQIYNSALSSANVAALSGVTAANTPVATDQSIAGTQNNGITGNVLTNSYDPLGLVMSATLLSAPSSGTLSLLSDGAFTYTPAANFIGSTTFTYEATDSSGVSLPGTVTLNVTPAVISGLQVTSVSATLATMVWTDTTPGLTGFVVQQSSDSVNWTTVATLGASSQSYTATGVNAGGLYYFRVEATAGGGNSNYLATPAVFTSAPPSSIIETTSSSGVTLAGKWWSGTFIAGYYGSSFLNDGNQLKGEKSVTFNIGISAAGNYDVAVWYPAASTLATNAPVTIETATGPVTEYINETQDGGEWVDLGVFAFNAAAAQVEFSNAGTTGEVVVNAVKLTSASVQTPPAPVAFTATAASSTSANLSWTENSALATGFVVQESKDNVTWTTAATLGATATSTTITGLTSGGVYYFRIEATGSQGNSAFVSAGPVTLPSPATVIVTTAQSSHVTLTGKWWSGTFIAGYYGTSFLNDGNQLQGQKTVTFNAALPAAGTYQVYIWNPAASTLASNVPVTIATATGNQTVAVNEQINGGQWVLLGDFNFNLSGQVIVSNTGANGEVVANAVMFVQTS